MTEFDKAFIQVSQMHSEELSTQSSAEMNSSPANNCDSVAFVPSQSESDAVAELAIFPDGTVTAEVIGLGELPSIPSAESFFETGDGEYQLHLIEPIDDTPAVVPTREKSEVASTVESQSINTEVDATETNEENDTDVMPTEVIIHDAEASLPRPHLGFPTAKAGLPTAELAQNGLVAEHPRKKPQGRRISAAALLRQSDLAVKERPTTTPKRCESTLVTEPPKTSTTEAANEAPCIPQAMENSDTIIPNIQEPETKPFKQEIETESAAVLPVAKPIEQESYTWPEKWSQTFGLAAGPFGELATQLIAWAKPPQCVIGILGCRPAAGSTTLTLGLGQQLADQQKRTILVDADFSAPDLANQLELRPKNSWNSALAGNISVENAILRCEDQRPSILPLATTVEPDEVDLETFCHRACDHLSLLADRYDIVLVDLGSVIIPTGDKSGLTTHCLDSTQKTPLEIMRESIRLLGPRLDTVLLVTDQDDSNEELERCRTLLEQSAVTPLGVVENFAA